jgi:hypothetical protein
MMLLRAVQFLSVDAAIQAPGAPEEDAEGRGSARGTRKRPPMVPTARKPM